MGLRRGWERGPKVQEKRESGRRGWGKVVMVEEEAMEEVDEEDKDEED